MIENTRLNLERERIVGHYDIRKTPGSCDNPGFVIPHSWEIENMLAYGWR